MNITHGQLLELGWEPINKPPRHYQYKGITGWFNPEIGTFHLDGFLPAITNQVDLRFIMMLIDYSAQDDFTPYPSH